MTLAPYDRTGSFRNVIACLACSLLWGRTFHFQVANTGELTPAIKAQIEKADFGMNKLMKDCIEVLWYHI